MFFTRLTFLAAFFIEGLASLVSIIGISSLFGNNLIVMSLMAALDVGKILVVSLLYSYWDKLPKLMKSYALVAATITMVITSAGAAGYLSSAFQQAIVGSQESAAKIAVLQDQQAKYTDRKAQIDNQIAALPEKTSVSARLRLIGGFKLEQERLDKQLREIDSQLPALQIAQISVESKTGPITFISKAFDIPIEQAIKWVILLIVFVFDPLAIFLVIAGNFLYAQQKREAPVVVDSHDGPAEVLQPQECVVSEETQEIIDTVAEETLDTADVASTKDDADIGEVEETQDAAVIEDILAPVEIKDIEESAMAQADNDEPVTPTKTDIKPNDLAKAVWGNIPKAVTAKI